jgi:hypothetical protein
MIWEILNSKGKTIDVVHAATAEKAMAAAKALRYKAPVLHCAAHAEKCAALAAEAPFKGTRHAAS